MFPATLILGIYIGDTAEKYPILYHMERISEMKYNSKFKCQEFSEALVERLNDKGIYADTVVGRKNDQRHMWVQVWIEPQTGKFIGTQEGYSSEQEIESARELELLFE